MEKKKQVKMVENINGIGTPVAPANVQMPANVQTPAYVQTTANVQTRRQQMCKSEKSTSTANVQTRRRQMCNFFILTAYVQTRDFKNNLTN